MIRKENLPFVVVLGALVVVFVAVLVWVHGKVSAKSTLSGEIAALRKERDELNRNHASGDYQKAVQAQLDEAKAGFDKLKQHVLAWYDAGVYDKEETPLKPTLFLGKLQDLRRQIRTSAEKHEPYPVVLAQGVENMAFAELGTDRDLPPAEVTYDLVKQRSIMRDVLGLLINDGVDEINDIRWGGKVKGQDLYDKYVVMVEFTCRYPALAKFQSDLLNNAKVSVSPFGDLPRNMFVIEDLSYETDDQKVAALQQAASASSASSVSSHRPGATRSTTTGTYGDSGHGQGRNPADTIRRPGGTDSMRRGGGRPPGGGGRTPTGGSGVRERAPRTDIPGRMPAYNILTVKMTIAMVDFTETVTGKPNKLEKDEDEEQPAGRTGSVRAKAGDDE